VQLSKCKGGIEDDILENLSHQLGAAGAVPVNQEGEMDILTLLLVECARREN